MVYEPLQIIFVCNILEDSIVACTVSVYLINLYCRKGTFAYIGLPYLAMLIYCLCAYNVTVIRTM